MAGIIENFAIAGTVLGVITTAMGIIVICVGPKAVKDYVLELYSEMWWHSFFGAARYKWLLNETIKSTKYAGATTARLALFTRIDIILRTVLDTWDPLAEKSDLEALKKSILIRPSASEIFSLELICHCVSSIDIEDKYFCAWEIIDSMQKRRIHDVTTGFNHEEIRRPTMELLRRGIINLVEAIPPVEVKFQLLISKSGRRKSKLIESEITGISDRFKEEMKCKMGSLSILLNMSRLLSILRESFPIDEPVISFDDRTRIILLLLDRDSSVALLNSFTFDSIIKIIREKTHVIKDKSETEFTTWECNFQI